MSLVDLNVVPDDVAARELGYRVDSEPAPEALVTTLFDHPQHPAALRVAILGASHAVTVVIDGNDTVTEEVSCRASTAGRGLPTVDEASQGPWGTHHLRGTIQTLSPSAFSAVVDDLTTRADSDPDILAGRFPGADGALTVVEAHTDTWGWQWRTWHLYPHPDGGDRGFGGEGAGGEVVTTVSDFQLALAGAATEMA